MQSEFKLLLQKNNRGHFAYVTVEAEVTAHDVRVCDRITQPLEDKAEVDRRHYADWIDAAVRGAQLCATVLIQRGDLPGCHLTVVRVRGVEVDTTDEDIVCAAALATWQALKPEAALPEFNYIGGEWRIGF